jgi:hypothetical protein
VKNNVDIRITDYTVPSLLNALQDVDILISLLHDNGPFYVNAHKAMLEACTKSKRFIPSEWGGDIDNILYAICQHTYVDDTIRSTAMSA